MWRCSPSCVDVVLDLVERRAAPAPGRRSAAPRPAARRRPCDCDVGSKPSRAPMPWQTMPRARVAVTRGSFCRSEPGRGVARVGEHRLAGVGHRLVEPLEGLDREEHLAAHLDQGRAPGTRRVPVSRCGHRVDGADVGRDVLAGAAVAAGQRPDQPAVLVEQVDREPVDLELAQQRRVVDAVARQPGVPRRQLVVGERVVEALHRAARWSTAVNSVETAPPTFWVGRVGGAQLGELLLELLEPRAAAGRSRRRRGSGRRARSSASGRPRSPRSADGGGPWPRESPTAVRPWPLSCQRPPTPDRPRRRRDPSDRGDDPEERDRARRLTAHDAVGAPAAMVLVLHGGKDRSRAEVTRRSLSWQRGAAPGPHPRAAAARRAGRGPAAALPLGRLERRRRGQDRRRPLGARPDPTTSSARSPSSCSATPWAGVRRATSPTTARPRRRRAGPLAAPGRAGRPPWPASSSTPHTAVATGSPAPATPVRTSSGPARSRARRRSPTWATAATTC